MAIQPKNLVHAESGYSAIAANAHRRKRYTETKQVQLTMLLRDLLHLADRDRLDWGAAMQDAVKQYLDDTDG